MPALSDNGGDRAVDAENVLVTMEGIGSFYIAPRLAKLKPEQPHLRRLYR